MIPFFSIIIPTYNRSHIISRAINSILSQSFSDFEIIVVDDGSTDNTFEVLNNYLLDKRIKFIFQENKGVCVARNNGVDSARAPYVAFLDSDDYVAKDWLKDFAEKLTNEDADFVFCDMKVVDLARNSVSIVKALFPYNNKVRNESGLYMSGAFCMKRSFFITIKGFDENIKYGEFTEFRFRCLEHQLKILHTENVGLIYESSNDGGSKNLNNKIVSNIYIINKHKSYFQKHPSVLRLYFQNIAVTYAKLGKLNDARVYFWKAYLINVLNVKTLLRFAVSLNPFLADKLWK